MINSKNALGKGLSALLSNVHDSIPNSSNFNDMDVVRELELSQIIVNPNQPRKEFDEYTLNELSSSISKHGVLQPILVRKIDANLYQIVAGERRYRASKQSKKKTIPAIVIDVSEDKVFELAIIENIQRDNLNPLDEAEAYQLLIEKYGYTHDQLAKLLCKSRSHISNVIRLNSLPEDVKKNIREHNLSLGHAKILVSAKDSSSLVKDIVEKGLSVRQAEKIVNLDKGRHKRLIREGSHVHFQKDSDLIEIEKQLQLELGLDVKINDTIDGGEVVIKFTHLNQLDCIINRLATDYNKIREENFKTKI